MKLWRDACARRVPRHRCSARPVKAALVALLLLWLLRVVLFTPSPQVTHSPPAHVATPAQTDCAPLRAPGTPDPFDAVKPDAEGRATYDVSVIVPCHGDHDPSALVAYLVGDTKSSMEIILAHDRLLQRDAIARAGAAAGSTPLRAVLVDGSPGMATAALHELANGGAVASSAGSKALLFLAPHLRPTTSDFVAGLLAQLEGGDRAGAAGCATLVQSAGGSAAVAQQGYTVRDSAAGEPVLVKRRRGFSALDERLRTNDEVHALAVTCLAVRRATFFRLRGFAKLRSTYDLLLQTAMLSGANSTGLLDRSVTLRRAMTLASAIEKELSELRLSDPRFNQPSFKLLIRTAFDGMSSARKEAEKMHVTLAHDTLDPRTQADLDASGTDILRRVPLLLHWLSGSVRLLRDLTNPASADELAWDLCLRLRAEGELCYSCGTVLATEERGAHAAVDAVALDAASYSPSAEFMDLWRASLRALRPVYAKFETQPVRVVWDAFCCGCCGFSNEIVHLVAPLEDALRVNLIPDPTCFCAGFPEAITEALGRMHTTYDEYVAGRAAADEVVVWVSHTDPMSYRNNVFARRRPDYVVGRSMYEFTRIDDEWVDAAAMHSDEIWVPAEWVKHMFAASGVPAEKMVVVPEAVDVHFFNPAAQKKLSLPLERSLGPERNWRHWCNRQAPSGAYVFYTNFKWEPRKGWDILFEAYYRAFRGEAGVVLYVHTRIWFSGGPETYGDKHNTTFLREEVAGWARARLGVGLDAFPAFCFLTEDLAEVSVAELYNTANAFVLPTRGEGWGLPTIQAMSMRLPTISTDWGGQTEFMDPDVTFPIPLDAVEELPADSVYRWRAGKKWGTPSLNVTAAMMRAVYDNPAKAVQVGARARDYVIRRFSEEAVARIVEDRIMAIRDVVLQRRLHVSNATS